MFERFRNPKLWIPTATVGSVAVLAGGTWLVFNSFLLAMVIALAVVLLVLVVVLLRTIFQQEREERLDRGIDDRDRFREAQRDQLQRSSQEGLEDRFRRAVDEIRRSRLGAEGLYELPWLLVIGERGAGKSELLRQSGLELPAEYAYLMRGGPTEDCDWWLANQAIVLDTSGSYLDDDDDAARQWRRLLGLLRRTRPKLPIDGVLLAIPAPALLGRSADELAQQGHVLRRRINELTDTLRLDVPIYLLVTKCDQIEGFAETANALARGRTHEAFGWTNDRRRFADAGEELLRGLEPLQRRLEQLLPETVMREADPRRRRRLFLFPEDFEETARSLAIFLRAAFAPSVYDEVPFLRGVYFTSARREGTALSPVLERLGHGWARSPVAPDAAPAGGLFVSDVLREIVLGDEDLAMPAHWLGGRTRRAVVAAVATSALAFLLFLGIGFVDNYRAIRRLATESEAVVAGASSLAALDRLRDAVAGRESDPFPLGRLGLNGPTGRALARARQTFTWAFGREFEEPAKSRLMAAVGRRDRGAFEALAELGLDIAFLAQRGDSPRPDLAAYAPVGRDEVDIAAFREGYAAFVRWIPDPQVKSRVSRERDLQMAHAQHLLDIRVLEEWSEESAEKHPPVRYADFGLKTPPEGPSTYVTGAYTRATWEALVIDLIGSVERSGGASGQAVADFREEYIKRYDRKWRDFLVDTPLVPEAGHRLRESPYVRLVEAIHRNIGAELPRSLAPPDYVATLRGALRDTPTPEEEEEKRRPPWQAYRATLEQVEADVAAAREAPERALDQSRKLSSPEQSAFHAALADVRALVPLEGDAQAAAKLRDILSMPILDGASAVLERALGELERRWVERIAEPFGERLDTQRLEALYDPNGGELSKFDAEALGHFYGDGRPLAVVGDRAMPFGEEFVAWMRSAENVQRSLFPGAGSSPEIAVRLEGVPSRIVGSTGFFVTRRDLRMACAEGVETFVYREGVGSHGFRWTPDCQQVSLRVFARGDGGSEQELRPRLEKNGPLAFPELLRSAQRLPGGRLQWRIQYDDPPLEVMIEYRLRGGEGVLEIAHTAPPRSMTQ